MLFLYDDKMNIDSTRKVITDAGCFSTRFVRVCVFAEVVDFSKDDDYILPRGFERLRVNKNSVPPRKNDIFRTVRAKVLSVP